MASLIKTVNVLAPNGRRQAVKVTPNTTILQVLEEVCKKQGFKPEEYVIKHHNHKLDSNAIIRFSGLHNNAQLEMATTEKTRTESSVTVGLQVENGDRLMGEFLPTESLWNVIKKLCPDEADPNSNPVIIYMREVIGSAALEETTLRSLGLTSGRAMLRFIHRTPEELHQQANVSAPLPQKPVKPVRRHVGRSTLVAKSTSPNSESKSTESEDRQSEDVSNNTSVTLSTDKDSLNSSESQDKVDKKSRMENAASGASERREIDSSERSETIIIPEPKKPEEDIILLGERSAIAFSLEMARSVPSEDLPDDFFELTLEEVRSLFKDLKRKRSELEEESLMTKAQRNLDSLGQKLSRMKQYRRTVIRVQFPDRTVLQGTFLPLETISTVMEFVREYLENPELDFYLYTTPPKGILVPGTNLIDSGCVPGAMIHFGMKNKAVYGQTYLKKSILTQFTSPSAATLAACRSRAPTKE